MEIKKLVLHKLKKLTSQKITLESSIYKIGIDSLDLVELVAESEEELNITISDEAIESIKFVKDIIDVLEKATK